MLFVCIVGKVLLLFSLKESHVESSTRKYKNITDLFNDDVYSLSLMTAIGVAKKEISYTYLYHG